jgi:hypothetical protein
MSSTDDIQVIVSRHVETVVLMGKTVTRSKSHVNLGLDIEDYYEDSDPHAVTVSSYGGGIFRSS